jgi:DNA uptake protein ComE-like DNA-binding protein
MIRLRPGVVALVAIILAVAAGWKLLTGNCLEKTYAIYDRNIHMGPDLPLDSKPTLKNINSACLADLVLVPGINRNLAKKILDYRKIMHGFSNWDDIQLVPGIGPARCLRLRENFLLNNSGSGSPASKPYKKH